MNVNVKLNVNKIEGRELTTIGEKTSKEKITKKTQISTIIGPQTSEKEIKASRILAGIKAVLLLKAPEKLKKAVKGTSAFKEGSPKETIDLTPFKLGSSSNPVALIKQEYYFNKNLLKAIIKEHPELNLYKKDDIIDHLNELKKSIRNEIKELKKTKEQLQEKKDELKDNDPNKELKEVKNELKNTINELKKKKRELENLEELSEKIETDYIDIKTLSNYCKKYKENIFETLTKNIHPSFPQQLDQYYDKQEIISNIRLKLLRTDEEGENRELMDLIKKITSGQENYLDWEALKGYMGEVGIKDETVISDFIKNITPLISSKELENISGCASLARAVLPIGHYSPLPQERKIEKLEAYVLKGGSENKNEKRASEKIKKMGFTTLLPKEALFIPENLSLEYTHPQAKKTEAVIYPLKSEFLSDYSHIDKQDWANWQKARQKYEEALFEFEKVTNDDEILRLDAEERLERTKQGLKTAEEEFLRKYEIPSDKINELIYWLLLTHANDAHLDQFMVGSKDIMGIDEGRSGAPLAFKAGNEVYLTFRNSLLTHPVAFQPISKEFMEFVRKQSAIREQVAQEMRDEGMVWTDDEFGELLRTGEELIGIDRALKRWDEIQVSEFPQLTKTFNLDQPETLTTKELFLQAVADKYQVTIDPQFSERKIVEQLHSKIREKFSHLQEIAFSKQSEKSFNAEMERDRRMSDYMINHKDATLYGAFEEAYPELKTIMKVLRRRSEDPGSSISILNFHGQLLPQSLSDLIETLESFATSAELQEMRRDLEKLKNEAAKDIEIALTYNLVL